MPLEIERKFLVLNDSYKEKAYSHSHIKQGYICTDPENTMRVRFRDGRAYFAVKFPTSDGRPACYEFEKEISLKSGELFMFFSRPHIIEKERWLVDYGGHTFEVDEFLGDNEGLVLAEVELASENEHVDLPDFIGKEVTGDKRYFNLNLSMGSLNDSLSSD